MGYEETKYREFLIAYCKLSSFLHHLPTYPISMQLGILLEHGIRQTLQTFSTKGIHYV